MDLDAVPEIGPTFAEKLREAGVPSAEALAAWEELPPLAERAGIDLARLEGFRDAARAQVEHALADAGVDTPQALAVAELGALAQRTGFDRAYLERYQRRAQEALGRVVLVEGAPVARVQVEGSTHHAVALVTAAPGEADEAAFARATGDAVLLREDAHVVPAVIGGVTHRALPLYRERRREAGGIEEVRVRVAQVREVPPRGTGEQADRDEGRRGIGRLFSRKK